MKRWILTLVVVTAVFTLTQTPRLVANPQGSGSARLDLVEATVDDLQKAIQTGLVTIEHLTEMYLSRIAAYDDAGPGINALLHVNEDAAEQAAALDAGRQAGVARGPLYGIPVLLKDNIDTADMPTTAGSVALAGSIPPDDAFITRKLRAAGAVIIGKATLTEYANFIAIGMPAGYSSLGNFGFNPYDPRPVPPGFPNADGRPVLTTGGSSSGSGIGVNANFAAVAIGTETSGSILSPASANGVVGIKPTVGLISRDGIIPITADQDTAGPITRTVRDAAILLGVIAGHDPNDAATAPCLVPGNCFSDYTQFLDKHALRGARFAVILPGMTDIRRPIMDAAVAVLRAEGATVDAITAPTGQRGSCVAYPYPIPTPPALPCSSVLIYGQKRDLNAYLANTPGAPMDTIADIVAFNATYVPPMKYGQAIFEAAMQVDITPGSADTLRYQADRAYDLANSRGPLDAIYAQYDAIVASANSFAATPAKAGYPSVSVPGGFIPPVAPIENPFPSNVTFSGPAFSEPRLIAFAYAFEQATQHRVPPASTPPLPTDTVVRP